MKNTRSCFTLIHDPKSKLSFKMLTHVPDLPDEYWTASWGDLHDLRSKVTKGLQHILDIAEKEKRNIDENENFAYQYGMEYLEALDEEFEIRADRNTKEPVDLSNGHKFHGHHIDGTFDGSGRIIPKKTSGKKGRSYKELFGEARDTGGFESFNDFLNVLKSGRYDSRLENLEKRAWVEGTGTAGGFAVPSGFYEQIWNTAIEDSVVLNRAQGFVMERGNLVIPAFANEDRQTDGLYGGMVPSWLGEASAATAVTGKLRTINLIAKKLALYSELSMEVISDSISLEESVTTALAKSISFYADYYLLRGDGVHKPLGVLNDKALLTVARNTGGSILFADIRAMYSNLYGPCVKNAVWVVSPSVVPYLLQLVDAGNHLIWTPTPVYAGAISGPVPNSLFGLPVVISEKLPSVGTKGDILLADFTNYAYGTAGTMILEKSNAPKWSEGLISYRGIIRLDGTGLWASPITSLNGDKLSWCVTLSA